MSTEARWQPRTYVCQTGKEPLDEVGGIRGVNAFKVFTLPYRLHTATITRAHEHAMWVVRVTSVLPNPVYRYHLAADAERSARDLISRRAGAELQRFTRGQRVYMGQQLCPKPMRAGGLCGQPAGVGTVWCEHHPAGEVSRGD